MPKLSTKQSEILKEIQKLKKDSISFNSNHTKVMTILDQVMNIKEEFALTRILPELISKTELNTNILHHAALMGNEMAIEILVQHGIDVNEQNTQALSALHIAVKNNKVAAIEKLLDLQAAIDLRDNEGRTPIHFLEGAAATKTLEILLNRGFNIDEKTGQNLTTLHFAVLTCNKNLSNI